MKRVRRRWGLILLAAVLVLWSVVFLVAAHATSGARFEHIVGLANVYAGIFAAVALVFMLVDRIQSLRADRPTSQALEAAHESLAAAVLSEERAQRVRLLSTDRADTQAIDLQYEQPTDRHLVAYRWAGGAQTGTMETIEQFYRQLRPGRLLILGEAGSGKTVLATHLLIQLLKPCDAATTAPVPVRFSLSTFDTTIGLESWLTNQLSARFQLHEQIAAELVRRRRILPVLDGLDEMDAEGTDMPRARAAIDAFNTYLLDDIAAPLIVTCRREPYYQRLGADLLDATWIDIQPLAADRIVGYLRKQMPRGESARRDWQALLDPLSRDPTGTAARALTRALRTPWLLTLTVTACRSGMDPSLLLPPATVQSPMPGAPAEPGEDHVDAYVADVEQRLLSHFVTAATSLHNARVGTEYNPDDVTNWLRAIAAHLRRQGEQGGSNTDIILHTWWPIAGVRRTRLTHGALAATVVFVGIVAALASFLDPRVVTLNRIISYTHAVHRLDPTFAIAAAIVLIGLVAMPWLAGMVAAQRRPTPSRSGLRHLRSHGGRRRLIVTATAATIAGLLGGLGIGISIGLASGLSDGLKFGLLYGASGGTVVGLAFGVAVGLDRGSADALTPGQLIRGDLAHGLIYGTLVGAAAGFSGGVSIGPIYGAVVGVGVGVAYGLVIGPVACLRYTIAVMSVAARGQLPWRFNRFLRWAADAGLLRVTGIAYQIRHRELQLWLTQATADLNRVRAHREAPDETHDHIRPRNDQ